MNRLEAAVAALGAVVIVLGIAAFDWRIGCVAAGIFCILSVIDVPRRRA